MTAVLLVRSALHPPGPGRSDFFAGGYGYCASCGQTFVNYYCPADLLLAVPL